MHTDKPGVIANVTNMMHWEYEDLNISNFSLSRQEKGGEGFLMREYADKGKSLCGPFLAGAMSRALSVSGCNAAMGYT